MSMEISPGCLHLFSDSWEVGGSISRPLDSDFEPGLELARAPYTLRLQSRAHQTMDERHKDWLRQTAANIRRWLPAFGPTRHPKLKPPSTVEGQALALARCERSCTAEQLAACLEATTTADNSRLIICRYGVKYPAQRYYQEKLMAARTIMTRELGEMKADSAWSQKVLDFGTETILNGHICLFVPSNDAHFLQFTSSQKINQYSLFGAAGNGYGGVSMTGLPQFTLKKLVAYPGAFKHSMFASGAPNFKPPRNATNQWYCQQYAKLMDTVQALAEDEEADVAGAKLNIFFGGGW